MTTKNARLVDLFDRWTRETRGRPWWRVFYDRLTVWRRPSKET
jgi:hypothetical protein